MTGDIDSGIWAISYMISMYSHCTDNFILFEEPKITMNALDISISEVSKTSCYMDFTHPLFSQKYSVKEYITREIGSEHLSEYNINRVRELFCISRERFEKPLSGMGNEIFKAMAAIGYVNKKNIFCFPWLSQRRFEYYKDNLNKLLEILNSLNVFVIFPVGK
jgi:hypothetical protein